jgi:hypothetical protein
VTIVATSTLEGFALEIHAHVPKPGKTWPHWLLEGLFIVASVLLAFGVAEFREARADRELAARVLNGVRAEMEHNLAILEPFVRMHTQWLQTLEKADTSKGTQTGLDVWFATRPPLEGKAPFPTLRRSAWDAAVSSGALRLIDYDVAADLADVYNMQQLATANLQRLASGPLSAITTYDPSSRVPAVRLLWLTLADIQSAESLLLDLYRQHLPTVRKAAGNEH